MNFLTTSKYFLRMPTGTGGTVTPGFTGVSRGEASENEEDEAGILSDQDVTEKFTNALDENLGAKSNSLDSLEDEPDPFLSGEIDVKEQMDRAADAMDASIHGFQNQAFEDSPQRELGASFKDTPGGLEEVAMKTDQELAKRASKRKH
jgi:hypothetical protein